MIEECISDTDQKEGKRSWDQEKGYNHLFRHSRSAELAQHLTGVQMEAYLGWVHDFDLSRTYVNLS